MDDGDFEHSENILFSNLESSSNVQASTSVNKFNEFLRNTRTCTHTHTCNPPGPDAAHTHTCYHTHTQVIASEEDDGPDDRDRASSKSKRPSGNREAVRKYREKKKAHTAYLEEEVKKLRLLNQQLFRKLQGQAVLEAEVSRLRSILVDLKGKIDTELGAFPFQKQCNNNSYSIFKEGHAIDICGNENFMNPWEGNCQAPVVNCQVNTNNMANTEGQVVDAADNLMSCSSQAV
ncbi:basic leucine zipper 24-like [Senna tora]|uniref:Basic leucine zipper 24-like n=1 Tax=Senna tora TaxID=362788 RepID=A0A834TML7_9FABA|nr:basic leucine zipper 24-like [Senna tora]